VDKLDELVKQRICPRGNHFLSDADLLDGQPGSET
jgi:hypothetical protein